MTRIGLASAVLAIAVPLGFALTLATYYLAVDRGRASPDPNVRSTTELRGWPAGYALELVEPVAEPGVRMRFEEQWLPSFLDDTWPIGRWSGFYFGIDWVLLSGTCVAALGGGQYLVRLIRRVTSSYLVKPPKTRSEPPAG